MCETSKPTRARSEPGLDIFRGLAVVLMFLAHVWRLQELPHVPPVGLVASLNATLAWMDRGVAYVAASFLFIAGFSLVLAHRRAGKVGDRAWFVALLRRAGWLYLLSLLLFVPEHGFELPDILASSGILSVVAVAVTLTAGAILAPRSNALLVGLAVVVLGGTYALERVGSSVSGLNAGPGGAIPLVMFCFLGALSARVHAKLGAKGVLVVAGAALPFFVFALIHSAPWLALYASEYTDHGGLAIAHWLGLVESGTGTVRSMFWNPSALGALGLIAPVAASAGAFLLLPHSTANHLVFRPVLLLGRHALFIFVAHYALLGLLDLGGLNPSSAVGTLGLLALITLICVAMSAVLEWYSKRIGQVVAQRGPPT